MTVLALEETHTFWSVALGLGGVVVAVVIVLMMLLLSFLRDIGSSVTSLLEAGGGVAENSAYIGELAKTGPVLDMILAEALIHDGYLESQLP